MAVMMTISYRVALLASMFVSCCLYNTRSALGFNSILAQDFCVAKLFNPAGPGGGKLSSSGDDECKEGSKISAADFSSNVRHPGNLSDLGGGIKVNFLDYHMIPGLYNQDLIFGRVDYEAFPMGWTAPHYHHKGAELITVLEGTVEIGLIISSSSSSSFPSFKLYKKALKKGDAFIIPQGVMHYQRNVGKKGQPAITYFFSGSANNGVVIAPNAVFGAQPLINTDYLGRAYPLDHKTIIDLHARFKANFSS